MRPASARQRGYTLIEVIVAFAVLGLALTLLLGTLSNGTRQVRWAADSGRAALHAQSLLDQVGIDLPLDAGQRTGTFEDGRYRWTLAIAPYDDAGADPAAAVAPQPVDSSATQLMALTLGVEWGAGGPRERLRIDSLRLRDPQTAAIVTGP
ncbi:MULTISPECIES: type II secretion system protein XpsI [Luteimonas]|uniref:type II secretion system protein XpsI n=1 Tax=Luteimonas TaxID=83614 RepID=UPI000C7DBD83|nr:MULTISPECIES: prepilin-type N-terminal cleavage/methylation domain-containing protein [Luteimonas]